MRYVGWEPPWTTHGGYRYGVWKKLDEEPLWDESGYAWVLIWEPLPLQSLSTLMKLYKAHVERVLLHGGRVAWLEDAFMPGARP